MTHHEIVTLQDGTRLYANGHRYKPMADEDRKHQVRKPKDPRAVRFHTVWLLPIEVLPDWERTMPATRPDSDTLDHRARCTCEVCKRPQAAILWRSRAVQRKEPRRG